MRTNIQSNTDSLEFCPDLAPASHIGIQNLSQTRDNRQAPAVFAGDILTRPRVAAHANHVSVVPKNSEKLDLISIMNSFAQMEQNKDRRQVESVHTVSGHQHTNHNVLAHVDIGEEKLSTLLTERYLPKKYLRYGGHSQIWPSATGMSSTRKRTRGIKVESKENVLTGLDLQLYQASQPQSASEAAQESSAANLQHVQSLCEEVKQFKVHTDPNNHSLSWAPNYQVHSAPPVYEPLRAPAEAMQQLVRDRLFLLDDHCFEIKLGCATSNPLTTTSKDRLIQQAAKKIDISHLSGGQNPITPEQLESIQVQALQCALARHSEALADAALEMVFEHCAQAQRTSLDNLTHETINKVDLVGSAAVQNKKRKAIGNRPDNDATQAQEELCSWVDVLQSLQSNAEKAAHRHNRHIEVHQDLPSLHLSDSVLERTTRRLRALYAGQTDAQLLRAVPTVFDYDKSTHRASHVGNSYADRTLDSKEVAVQSEGRKNSKKKKMTKMKEEDAMSVEALMNTGKRKNSKVRDSVGGKLKPPVVPVAVWAN